MKNDGEKITSETLEHMDIGQFAHFTGLNLAVAISSLLAAIWMVNYRVQSLSKLLIAVLVLFCSQILATEIALGIFGELTLSNVSIATYAILAVLVVVLGYKVVKKTTWEKKTEEYPNFFVVLLVFGPIIFLLSAKAFNAVLQIPLEYDTVSYHLPFVAKWLQTGNLNEVYYSAFAGPLSYYPSNYELLDLWTFLPFRNDFFANLLNFPLFAALVLVIWRILRNADVDQYTAVVGAAIPLYMPIFLRQAGIPYVDLFFTLTFAIAVFYVQEITQKKELKSAEFFLFGLSMGLFVGTKYLGIVYGIVIVGVLALISCWKWRRSKGKLIKAWLIASVGVLLTGSFFYMRNWIDAGNPLFPVDLTLFGVNILEGYKAAGVNERLADTSILHNLTSLQGIQEKIRSFFYMTGAYGLVTIVLPAVILLNMTLVEVYRRITQKKWSSARVFMTQIVLGALLVVYLYLYVKAPYTYRDFFANVRYAMPYLVLGALGISYMVQQLGFLKKTFYVVSAFVFTFSFLFLVFDPPSSLPYTAKLFIDYDIIGEYKEALVMLAIAYLSLFYIYQLYSSTLKSQLMKYTTLSLLLLILTSSIYTFFDVGYREREVLREYWLTSYFIGDQDFLDIAIAAEWLNKNAPGRNIAYSGFNFHYYLYGRNFSSNVDYININECAECRYVDYKDAKDSIRRDPSYDHWFENVSNANKEYLVVNPYSTPGVRGYEYEWAEENPEHFEQVFKINNVYIYKVTGGK